MKTQAKYLADGDHVRHSWLMVHEPQNERWLDTGNDVYYPDSLVFDSYAKAQEAIRNRKDAASNPAPNLLDAADGLSFGFEVQCRKCGMMSTMSSFVPYATNDGSPIAREARIKMASASRQIPRQMVDGGLCCQMAAGVSISGTVNDPSTFQPRVGDWLRLCFENTAATEITERCDRFLEEAFELVQALGYPDPIARANKLMAYTFGRPAGEPAQELGGVMTTLAALCNTAALDMMRAGEDELARVNRPEVIAKVRAKDASKPKDSPLPGSSDG